MDSKFNRIQDKNQKSVEVEIYKKNQKDIKKKKTGIIRTLVNDTIGCKSFKKMTDSTSKNLKFGILPDDCISEIISFGNLKDNSKMREVSKHYYELVNKIKRKYGHDSKTIGDAFKLMAKLHALIDEKNTLKKEQSKYYDPEPFDEDIQCESFINCCCSLYICLYEAFYGCMHESYEGKIDDVEKKIKKLLNEELLNYPEFEKEFEEMGIIEIENNDSLDDV